MDTNQKKIGEDWITARVDSALKESPVAAAAVTEIKKQLNGKMREQALPAGDLTKLAKNLLAAISDTPAKSGTA